MDASGRRKHLVPRSVLFADSDAARQDDDFRPRKSSSSSPSSFSSGNHNRKRFDRSPLTQQEANAFMSLLNQALAGTSSPSSPSSSFPSTAVGGGGQSEADQTPFGRYTSLVNDRKTPQGSKAMLQAFAQRNRLRRSEEAREQRARRFVREGLAAQIDPLELEAGVDEAREQIAMCENLAEVLEWAKKEVWGLTGGENATLTAQEDGEGMTTNVKRGPKYGKDTPFYASVIQLLFLVIRDRYRDPHVALSVARITRSLGIESYVLGVTGSMYNEILRTQWDWLGDLQGVVTTLRQARESGVISLLPSIRPDGSGGESKFAKSEDETIRETVDRIANEVRKYVVDQQMACDPAFKRSYLYGDQAEDVLGGGIGGEGGGEKKVGETNWSQKWLLVNAEEATSLAGKPFRVWYDKDRENHGSRGGRGGGGGNRSRHGGFNDRDGERERRGGRGFDGGRSGRDGYHSRDGGREGREGKSFSRYPSNPRSSPPSFGSRPPRSSNGSTSRASSDFH